MNHVKKKYRVVVESIKEQSGIGTMRATDEVDETFLMELIKEITSRFQTFTGNNPDSVRVKVSSNKEVIDSQMYSIQWHEDASFKLTPVEVEINSLPFTLGRAIEEAITKEVDKLHEKTLLKKIDAALDENDKEEFMHLTGALKELRRDVNHD